MEAYVGRSIAERVRNLELSDLLSTSPMAQCEPLDNLGLFLEPREYSCFLAMAELYRRIINFPGDVLDFGCRWGGNVLSLVTLREIFEPYNASPMIRGFDSFAGLRGVGENALPSAVGVVDGRLGVSEAYESYLVRLLDLHHQASCLGRICREGLYGCDVRETVTAFLARNLQSEVAMAYLDLVLYVPTVETLAALEFRFVSGSLLVFDQIFHPRWPGGVGAVREFFGGFGQKLRKFAFASEPAYDF